MNNCRRHKDSSAGFTLIEITVVIVILATAMLLIWPRLPDTGATALKSSARTLSTVIRYLEDQAANTRITHRLRLTTGTSESKVTVLPQGGTESPSNDTFFNNRILSEKVVITDVQQPHLGTVSSGEALVEFGPGGLSEYTVIHLKEPGGKEMSVIVSPNRGRVTVEEGYKEATL